MPIYYSTTNKKRMKNNKQAQVFHFDVFGKRQDKYDFLDTHSIDNINWNELQPENPNYFLVSKDFEGKGEYEKGFKIDEIFNINSSGIKTHRDHFVIDFQKEILLNRINEFYNSDLSNNEIGKKFELRDNRDWSISAARNAEKFNSSKIQLIEYRPFDKRFCYYESSLIDFGRENVMKHFLIKNNYGLSILRQSRAGGAGNYWINNSIIGKDAISSLDTCTAFPLYLYPETNVQQTIGQTTERTPNLNMEIVNQIAEKLGLTFVPEKEPEGNVCFVNNAEVRPDFRTTFAPIDILDYIYAALHSPAYREKYKEFLKIDFPRVPYPKNTETFWHLVELGGELRQIHLLESPVVGNFITSYPEPGSNVVDKVKFVVYDYSAIGPDEFGNITYPDYLGAVYINDEQYFADVPTSAWEFYIGGYQPAQKWLKDRKGRTLGFEDIIHYQKIIVALTETHRLMKEVDKVGVE
jgi:predicted helicase